MRIAENRAERLIVEVMSICSKRNSLHPVPGCHSRIVQVQDRDSRFILQMIKVSGHVFQAASRLFKCTWACDVTAQPFGDGDARTCGCASVAACLRFSLGCCR
jgi:hypothetical protein